MGEEVRYHKLRPGQIVARRKACPIAYVPIGTIEWHGEHLPVGADTLQAEAIAVRCAEKGGGLAFPALYYGESRVESLMDSGAADKSLIHKKMELPDENFEGDKQPFSAMEQVQNYCKLLLHILAEVESLGFAVGVLVAGHYPLIDHARAAVLQFNKRRYSKYHGMLAWAFLDYLPLEGEYGGLAGDHAGIWETSHMLAIEPETVDIKALGEKGEKMIGVLGESDPREASAEFGRQTLEKAVDIAIAEAHHRLKHRELYTGHGCCLREGLWRRKGE